MSTIQPAVKDNDKFIHVNPSRRDSLTNDATIVAGISIVRTPNSPGTKIATPEAWMLLTNGRGIQFVPDFGSETTPFGWQIDVYGATNLAAIPYAAKIDQGADRPDLQLPEEVLIFSLGSIHGKPDPRAIEAATKMAMAAIQSTTDPEFFIDSDGSFYYDLRLRNGLRVMGEINTAGDLEAGFYDDRNAEQSAREVRYLAQTSAEELIQFLK